MSFFQKIYFSNKPLILASSKERLSQFPKYTSLTGANTANFHHALHLLEQAEIPGVILIEEDKAKLEKELLWSFYPMHSAGGVVINEKQEILMIYRRGKWDLPKGKLDEGETLEACALREVTEETGLSDLQLGEKICNSMHIYPMQQQYILKYTAWYRMQGSSAGSLQPQAEEMIEQVRWVPTQQIPQLIEQSFGTIADVLQEANIL